VKQAGSHYPLHIANTLQTDVRYHKKLRTYTTKHEDYQNNTSVSETAMGKPVNGEGLV